MVRLFIFGVLLLIFISCKQTKGDVLTADTSTFEIVTETWPKKSNISSKAVTTLKDWPEFNAMEASFDALYTVENIEDLKLVINDLIEKQKLLAKSEYPEIFDTPQIKSRQKVFHTFMLKVKSAMEYQLDTKEAVLEMINAYNSLRNQFNVIIVSNQLDIKSLLKEQDEK